MAFLEALLGAGGGDSPFEKVETGEWRAEEGSTDIPVQMQDYDLLVAWAHDDTTYNSGAASSNNPCCSLMFFWKRNSKGKFRAGLTGSYYNNLAASSVAQGCNDYVTVKGGNYAYWVGTWTYIAIKLKETA